MGPAGRARTPSRSRHRRDLEVAAHPPGEVAGDRQAEAVPAIAREPASRSKRSKIRARSAGRSRAVVADDEHGDRALEPPDELDAPAGRRELQGVAAEVREDLLDAPAIAGRGPERAAGRSRADVPLDRDRQQPAATVRRGLRDGERLDLELERPGLEPRQLEQVADELAIDATIARLRRGSRARRPDRSTCRRGSARGSRASR
jgi:hypothetical protein